MSHFPIDSLIDVAMQAGDLVLGMQAAGLQNTRNKSTTIDLVTEADLACERFLREALGKLLPGASFWGEESNELPESEYFWLVDPIDGTTNFAHGLPYFAISIALNRLSDDNGEQKIDTQLGVLVELPAQHVYWAEKGKGAFVRAANGEVEQLQVNQVAQLNQAVLAASFPYHAAQSPDHNGLEFAHFVPLCQSMRSLGAAALDIAYVSRGVLTAFWGGWLGPWDAAASVLMVREAGGVVTDYHGDPWALHLDDGKGRGLVASNGQPAIHHSLLDGIRTARTGLTESLLDL